MGKSAIAFLFFIFLVTMTNPNAQAQTNSCSISFSIGPWCTPFCLVNTPPTTTCDNPCVFFCSCRYKTNACPPLAAPAETGCKSCSRPVAGQPIDLATGDTYIVQTDITLPGLGGGLELTRVWNSIWPPTQTGTISFMFGPNWTSTYQERVFIGNDGYVKYARNDGNFWSFGVTATGSAITYGSAAPANAGATLTSGPTNWTLTFKDGEKRLFDNASGHLTAIMDRNGNTTQLAYDSLNRLATVTDPASRHLNFTYLSSSSSLVSQVTTDFGVTLSYSYDAQGRLTQVTRPDNTTLAFQYDANSNITAVLDSAGKVLESHTYDSAGRGLSTSRANGVEGATITY